MRGWGGAAIAAGLGLLAACGEEGTGPGIDGRVQGGGGAGVIRGSVITVSLAPDSSIVPVGGVAVEVYLVGSVPDDTTTPPDSSGMTPLMGFAGLLDPPSSPPDTVLGDSIPWPPPPPSDTTAPPDTTTPPPPPPIGCGRTGELVATVTTNPEGLFAVPNLARGKYDLVAVAPNGYSFDGYYCGVHLLSGQVADIMIFLPPAPDQFSGLRRR